MTSLAHQVSKYRLGGEPCPRDLEVLITHCSAILHDMGVEISGDSTWAPWADKSYLTEADYRDPDIAANVKAIDDTCALISFVGSTDEGECIGYWRGPERRAISASPLVCYDTEGQFTLCGSKFIEALFFISYDEEALERLRAAVAKLGVPLEFASIDEIVIPQTIRSPDSFHKERYEKHKEA